MDGARSPLIFIICICCTASVPGQQFVQSARPASGGELLLLTNGQLIENPFSVREDGYEVRFPGGPQFIESSRVLCVAKSRTEAWRQLRGTFQSFTPDIHLQLARWCMRNQLSDCAERELLDALNLDPNLTDARELLREVTGRRLAASRSTQVTARAGQIPGAPGVVPVQAAQSLGGLSADNARGFVRRVQPLLANRCVAAGCHGSGSPAGFQLASIRNGSNPVTAERNLAAVLKQIQPTDPLRSPLLLKAEQLHGGMRDPAFRGRIGAQQQQILRDWVVAAVHDLHPELEPAVTWDDPEPAFAADDEQASLEAAAMPPRSVLATGTATPSGTAEVAPAAFSELAHSRPADRQSADRKLLQQAARSVARDPFSPALFNRRFHGTTDDKAIGTPLSDEAGKDTAEAIDLEFVSPEP